MAIVLLNRLSESHCSSLYKNAIDRTVIESFFKAYAVHEKAVKRVSTQNEGGTALFCVLFVFFWIPTEGHVYAGPCRGGKTNTMGLGYNYFRQQDIEKDRHRICTRRFFVCFFSFVPECKLTYNQPRSMVIDFILLFAVN